MHHSGGGLALFFEELRQRAVRAVDHRQAEVEQEVDDLGAGHEIPAPKRSSASSIAATKSGATVVCSVMPLPSGSEYRA